LNDKIKKTVPTESFLLLKWSQPLILSLLNKKVLDNFLLAKYSSKQYNFCLSKTLRNLGSKAVGALRCTSDPKMCRCLN
jgi:hypothetical protein